MITFKSCLAIAEYLFLMDVIDITLNIIRVVVIMFPFVITYRVCCGHDGSNGDDRTEPSYRSCMLSRFLISSMFMMCMAWMTHSDLYEDRRPSGAVLAVSRRNPRLWARPAVASIFIYKRTPSSDKLVFTITAPSWLNPVKIHSNCSVHIWKTKYKQLVYIFCDNYLTDVTGLSPQVGPTKLLKFN